VSFQPGPPHFFQTGENTWVESVWSRQRCVFCPERLAQGDRICCPTCRVRLDQEPLQIEED
jgi:hypothetical protein